MKKKQSIKAKSINNSKSPKTQQNLDILGIITEYNTLYINGKKAANLSKNTINNANVIFERFYQYCADEVSENEQLPIKNLTKYFFK